MEEALRTYFKMRDVFRGRNKRWAKQDKAAKKEKIVSKVVDQSMATCINHKKKDLPPASNTIKKGYSSYLLFR